MTELEGMFNYPNIASSKRVYNVCIKYIVIFKNICTKFILNNVYKIRNKFKISQKKLNFYA